MQSPAARPLALGAALLLCAAATQSAPSIDRTVLPETLGLAPGLWRTTIIVETMELEPLPGRPPVPAAALAAARSRIGTPMDSDDCIAPRTRAEDDLFMPGVRIGLGCPIEIVEAAAGRLRYRARCDDGEGFVAETSGEASYAARSIEGRHRLDGTMPGPGIRMRSTMRAVSRHDGQCAPRAPRPGR
ncbi:MAG TPA: DUF3617 family protein [Allosphingosinicella sp.]|jgi:hypothetical protein